MSTFAYESMLSIFCLKIVIPSIAGRLYKTDYRNHRLLDTVSDDDFLNVFQQVEDCLTCTHLICYTYFERLINSFPLSMGSNYRFASRSWTLRKPDILKVLYNNTWTIIFLSPCNYSSRSLASLPIQQCHIYRSSQTVHKNMIVRLSISLNLIIWDE